MKTRNITVGIRSLGESVREFVSDVHSLQRNEAPRGEKERIDFPSIEAMRQVLTSKRLQLLRLVRSRRPKSVYELAQFAGRDIKNVQDDVAMLVRMGLLDLTRSKQARARIIPHVLYDRIQIQIPVI
jgi:predicted transcriptional regulator